MPFRDWRGAILFLYLDFVLDSVRSREKVGGLIFLPWEILDVEVELFQEVQPSLQPPMDALLLKFLPQRHLICEDREPFRGQHVNAEFL